jgi:hypothetical protein
MIGCEHLSESGRGAVLGAAGHTPIARPGESLGALPMPTGVFAVLLEQQGGQAGSPAAGTCNFTYQVSDIAGAVLDGTDAAPIQPQAPRWPNLAYTAATRGLASWNLDGSLSLEIAYEVPATYACAAVGG